MNIHIYPFCPLVKYPGCFESDKAINGCHYFVFSGARTSGNISTVKCTLLFLLWSMFNTKELMGALKW